MSLDVEPVDEEHDDDDEVDRVVEGAFGREGLWFWEAPWEEDHHAEAFALSSTHVMHRVFKKSRHTKKFRTRIEGGPTLEEALGKQADVVPLANVRRLRFVADDSRLLVGHRGDGKRGTLSVDCSRIAPERGLFDALRDRVAPGVHPYPGKLSAWEAAKEPLVALGVALFVGLLLLGGHYLFEDHEEAPGGLKGKVLYWIVKALGLSGILVSKAIVVCVCLGWLIVRVNDPPEVEEISLP